MRIAFSSDFDNTLHFPGGISKQDLAVITRFRQHGGIFGINTGRSAGSLLRQERGIIKPDFLITVSGALVQGPEGEVFYDHPLPRTLALELISRYRWPSLGLCVAVEDISWAVPPLAWVPPLARRITNRGAFTLGQLPDTIHGLALRFFREKDATRVASDMRRRYGDELAIYQNLASLDVVAGCCSKGAGLRIVARELGFDLVAAMGDAHNDLPQLEAADVAYTFPGAPVELRKAADALKPSVAAALTDFMRR